MTALSRRRMLEAASAAALVAAVPGCSKPPEPAPTADALRDLDGVGVAELIRNREITALEAVEAAIARAEKLQPQLNFMVTKLYDLARANARDESQSGALAGVPILVKDLLDLIGAPTRNGSRAFANAPAATTQPDYTSAFMKAGVVPIGKSTTPEFGFTATTEPLLTGQTKNPWNPEFSSGGSSGGAAVAVAAGVVPLAHASDGGGSIRIPASCNGLVGLKPSRDRCFVAGPEEQAPVPISVNGCVSRSVRDTVAWLLATQRNGAGQVFEPLPNVAGPATRRLKIGMQVKTLLGRDPDPEIARAMTETAAVLKGLGHEVRDFTVPLNGQRFNDAFVLLWASSAQMVRDLVRQNAPAAVPLDQILEPLTLQLADHAQKQGPAALARAIAFLKATEVSYAGLFPGIDVLFTPTLAKPTVKLGVFAPTLPFDQFMTITDYVAYTPLINVTGAPAISLPLAMSSTGMPIGMHFAAAKGDEKTLLELAFELEAAKPWKALRPAINAFPAAT